MDTQPSKAKKKFLRKSETINNKNPSSSFKFWDNIFSYGLLPILIIVLWETATRLNITPAAILPPIEAVYTAFINQINNGEMIADVTVSLTRVLKGYSYAVVLGLSFGSLMGISLRANKIFSSVFNGIRQIPPLAWIPLIILWFGIGEVSKVVIIAKGAFFPILLNTINGIKNTPKGYLEVAELHNISKLDLFRKVYFPSSLPSVFVGLRLGLGVAWAMVVAAEIIASSSGLGYRINDSRALMQSDVMIANMIVIGFIGSIMDLIIRNLAKHFSKWQVS